LVALIVLTERYPERSRKFLFSWLDGDSVTAFLRQKCQLELCVPAIYTPASKVAFSLQSYSRKARSTCPHQQQCWSNIVEATGNFVAVALTLLPKTATMSKQHSTMQHSTMLLRHCCWCGRGLTCALRS